MPRILITLLLAHFALTACSNDSSPGTALAKDSTTATATEAASETAAVVGAPAIVKAPIAATPPEAPTATAIDGTLPPLAIEKTGRVDTLPASYPETWMMVDEVSFMNMFGGKIIVLDVAETNPALRIKGMMPKNLMGNFTQSARRAELYIMESFHARGARGKLTDVLAIYDKSSLDIIKEIDWPVPKRMGALPERYSMAVSKDESLLYVANFNPAASFTVIDLDSKTIVGEVGTPGCVLTYPTGEYSVASLCSNGGLLTTVLNKDGTLKSQHRLAPFFDTDDTPIFERPAIIDGMAYFPSFKGQMHVIDLSGEQAAYIESWPMLTDAEKAANRRPSGLVLNDQDDQGHMYVIVQTDGKEGTQTHGGNEVWVYDPVAKKRVRIIETPSWAVSIAVSRGDNPLLVVTNGEMNLDIYDAVSGKHIQTVGDFGNVTPLMVHKSY